jgi:hypothetical protein
MADPVTVGAGPPEWALVRDGARIRDVSFRRLPALMLMSDHHADWEEA